MLYFSTLFICPGDSRFWAVCCVWPISHEDDSHPRSQQAAAMDQAWGGPLVYFEFSHILMLQPDSSPAVGKLDKWSPGTSVGMCRRSCVMRPELVAFQAIMSRFAALNWPLWLEHYPWWIQGQLSTVKKEYHQGISSSYWLMFLWPVAFRVCCNTDATKSHILDICNYLGIMRWHLLLYLPSLLVVLLNDTSHSHRPCLSS